MGEEERREQEAMAQGKERGDEEERAGVGGVGEPREGGGFLSSVVSKIGAAMSGANGSNGAEEDGKGNGSGNAVASDGEEEGKKDGNGGGGIFDKLLSSSPASSPALEAEEEKTEGKDQDEGGEQAGILSTVASKIGMAMSGANGNGTRGSEEDAKASNGTDAAGQSNGEEKGDEVNGGGIVKQLISNLPSDDQVPEADEASLLIAIIED